MTPPAPTRLFVYGTLDPAAAPPVIRPYVLRLTFVSDATVPGRLYDFTRYPGLVLAAAAPSVYGRVFDLPNDNGLTLAAFDRYEGAPTDRASDDGLFLRVPCQPLLPDGTTTHAWVYVYNRPAPASRLLTAGRWLRTLRP